MAGVTLEDPHTEDLSQEVRGFIFSRILVCSLSYPFTNKNLSINFSVINERQERKKSINSCILLLITDN